MPALNFQKQFAALVALEIKSMTIRAKRKRPIKIGDKLYLYTGMRTKQCKKLKESICIREMGICITINKDLYCGEIKYSKTMKDRLAKLDGFKDFNEMSDWFEKTHGLPFNGQLIMWGN